MATGTLWMGQLKGSRFSLFSLRLLSGSISLGPQRYGASRREDVKIYHANQIFTLFIFIFDRAKIATCDQEESRNHSKFFAALEKIIIALNEAFEIEV